MCVFVWWRLGLLVSVCRVCRHSSEDEVAQADAKADASHARYEEIAARRERNRLECERRKRRRRMKLHIEIFGPDDSDVEQWYNDVR